MVDQFKLKSQNNLITASNKSLNPPSTAIHRLEQDEFIDATYLIRKKLQTKLKDGQSEASQRDISNTIQDFQLTKKDSNASFFSKSGFYMLKQNPFIKKKIEKI